MKVSALTRYREELNSSFSRDLEGFEKNFLLIASAVLAFSITFIKDIVKAEDAELFYLLFISWFFFAAAVGLMLCTFPYSARVSDRLSKCTNDFIVTNKLYDDSAEIEPELISEIRKNWTAIFMPAKKALSRMRNISMIVFLAGIIAFGLFVGKNLLIEKERKSAGKQGTENKVIVITADSLKMISKDTLIIIK